MGPAVKPGGQLSSRWRRQARVARHLPVGVPLGLVLELSPTVSGCPGTIRRSRRGLPASTCLSGAPKRGSVAPRPYWPGSVSSANGTGRRRSRLPLSRRTRPGSFPAPPTVDRSGSPARSPERIRARRPGSLDQRPRRGRGERTPPRTRRARGTRRLSSIGVEEAVEASCVRLHHLRIAAWRPPGRSRFRTSRRPSRARTARRARARPAPRRCRPAIRTWSRRQPLVEPGRLDQLERRHAARDRHRVARQRAGLVDRPRAARGAPSRRACRRKRRAACRRRSPCRAPSCPDRFRRALRAAQARPGNPSSPRRRSAPRRGACTASRIASRNPAWRAPDSCCRRPARRSRGDARRRAARKHPRAAAGRCSRAPACAA